MKIGMTSFGADGGKSGISQYVIQLLRQFGRADSTGSESNQIELYLYDSERSIYPLASNVCALEFSDTLRNPLRNIAWHQWSLGRWCREREHDVLFLPAGNRRLPLRVSCPTVGTVHDFSSLHVKGKYDWARMGYIRHVLPRLIRRLTRILTVSESSKRDIVEYCHVDPDKVIVSPLAVDHELFFPRDKEESQSRVEQSLGVAGPFILYISRLEHPGKNHVRLIQAFNQLKRKHGVPHRLLLVGSDWNRADAIHREAALSPWAHEIVMPGFVDAALIPDLYAAADLHVFPSLYEGFGLPILEAMATGAPTACSNSSSLPEVAGDSAELFDPQDVDSIEASMSRLLLDGVYRQQIISRGLRRAKQFHWQRTAEQTLRVLQEAAAC